MSDHVFTELNKMQPVIKKKSWDSILRKLLGLPDRQGNKQILIEGVLETITGQFLLKESRRAWNTLETDAYEIAFFAAAKRKLKQVPKPIKMRELP